MVTEEQQSKPVETPFSNWRNVAVRVEAVGLGESISVEVEGGCVHKDVPSPGILVTAKSGYSVYVPREILMADGAADAVAAMREKKCVVRGCSNITADNGAAGALCVGCYSFVCGLEGGETSQAYRNAVSAAKSRRTPR